MTKEEKDAFLANFKPGEYTQLTILVNTNNLTKLVEGLRALNMNLAVLPHVQDELDFQSDDGKGQS